jgi:hypothetical protein
MELLSKDFEWLGDQRAAGVIDNKGSFFSSTQNVEGRIEERQQLGFMLFFYYERLCLLYRGHDLFWSWAKLPWFAKPQDQTMMLTTRQ